MAAYDDGLPTSHPFFSMLSTAMRRWCMEQQTDAKSDAVRACEALDGRFYELGADGVVRLSAPLSVTLGHGNNG